MPRRAWTSKRNCTRAYLRACRTSEFSAVELRVANTAPASFMLICLHQHLYIDGFHLSHFSTGSMSQRASKNKLKVSSHRRFLQPWCVQSGGLVDLPGFGIHDWSHAVMHLNMFWASCSAPPSSRTAVLPSHESKILLLRTKQPARGAHQVTFEAHLNWFNSWFWTVFR